MLIPTIVVQIPFYGKSDDAIGILSLILGGIECCILLISIFPMIRKKSIEITSKMVHIKLFI